MSDTRFSALAPLALAALALLSGSPAFSQSAAEAASAPSAPASASAAESTPEPTAPPAAATPAATAVPASAPEREAEPEPEPTPAPAPAPAASAAPPVATVPSAAVAPPVAPKAAALPPEATANAPTGNATTARDDVIRDARDAFLRHDRARLDVLRATALANRLALAPWVDYWELVNRLSEVSSPEVEQFYARWPGTYVEDRLRNDWLLEVGRRHDWDAFKRDFPRFRMNDDRDVACYATLIDHLAGK